ncbi:MAG: hypothetical protein Hyperionvirus12_54 [Hyperionvirus sp.]|uniref:Uncharacterized protein n=1 Tax=Hyperionvirus sp. TaxID=2487770 RepID=A0A3G5A9B2_9VIRU|nr:MAG: hypothetical protein Hyperionvirus12_54 [Hyperionvirus sp.]
MSLLLTIIFLIIYLKTELSGDNISKQSQIVAVYHFSYIIAACVTTAFCKNQLSKQPSRKRIRGSIDASLFFTLPSTTLGIMEILNCIIFLGNNIESCYESESPLTILMLANTHCLLLIYAIWIIDKIKNNCKTKKRNRERVPIFQPQNNYNEELNI